METVTWVVPIVSLIISIICIVFTLALANRVSELHERYINFIDRVSRINDDVELLQENRVLKCDHKRLWSIVFKMKKDFKKKGL